MDTMQQQPATTHNTSAVFMRSAAIVTLIGIPFMLLLMYCAWLPYWMGMYFFILDGLLMGGIWYRLAYKVRPAPAGLVYATYFAALAVWTLVYLGSESYVKRYHLARDLAGFTHTRQAVYTPEEQQQRQAEATAHVEATLRSYGPGPIGYLAWNAASGEIPPLQPYGVGAVLPQRQLFWIARVVLSILLLAYGLRLQVKELTKPEEDPDATTAPPSPAG